MDGKTRIIDYHRRTKHFPNRYAVGPGYLDWENQPNPFRTFQEAPTRDLPLAADHLTTRFEDLVPDQSVPSQPMNQFGVAALFELALGISAWKSYMGERWAVRCNPSSGNLHPTEGYLISPEKVGPGAGIWHYESEFHRLELRGKIQEPQWSDSFPDGLFFVALTTIHGRESWKYGERAFRYCQLNLGHAEMAFRVAASVLGWQAVLLDESEDAELIGLLGLQVPLPATPVEQEQPGTILVISSKQAHRSAAIPLYKKLLGLAEFITWNGQANRLSEKPLRNWHAVEQAQEATQRTVQPVILKTAVFRNVDTTFSPETPPPLPCPTKKLAADLIRQRRSAVRYDRKGSLSLKAFFRILDSLLPRKNSGPWDLFNDDARIHPILMVHDVDGLKPGLYALVRRPGALDLLKKSMKAEFLWNHVDHAPEHLPLYHLLSGDARLFAKQISCNQEIAADGFFSLGMLTEFENRLNEGAWYYRRLHEEAGAVGQILYLEAEAAGFQGTGIGCFFDDLFHQSLGLEGEQFQTLYHFTVGVAVPDNRLEVAPPYAHLLP
ncbi:MAG: SagB/ThcOx family dehydrogenase [Magnetococcales bacterium]|nr:SagB/ThcOx family dehydrogenase [Magnetococcales bacterium]